MSKPLLGSPPKLLLSPLAPVVVVLVDLPLAVGVDDRDGLAGGFLCVLVTGREGPGVYEGILLVRGPSPLRERPLRTRSGMVRCRAF